MRERKTELEYAFPRTVPVMAGYLVLGAAYGILMADSGFGAVWSVAISLMVYAGSLQYLGVSLLTAGAGPVYAFLMSVMLNARHLFYGISMLDRFRGMGWKKIYLIFGMCDETFSINYTAEIPPDVDRGWFMFFVTLLNHFYWFSGSTLGGIFGSLIHFDTEGLDFVMTAMFVVIFLEQWLKEKNHASSLLGLALSLICLIAFEADNFIIPAMLAILILLTMIRRPLEARISSSTDITKETEKGGGQP